MDRFNALARCGAGDEARRRFDMAITVGERMGPEDGMQWVRREMHRDGFEPHTWDHKRGGYIWRRAEREKETA